MPPSILIAGIGNIFLGDDGFGSEVARRLAARSWPEGVRVVDYGIRGFDVAFALMDGVDVAILVDAAPQGGSPGTLYVIEPDLAELNDPQEKACERMGTGSELNPEKAGKEDCRDVPVPILSHPLRELPVDTHAMNPTKVFQLVRAMGGEFNRVLIVGCEPGDFGPEEEGRMGLSPPVAAAVGEAEHLIDKLIAEVRGEVSAVIPKLQHSTEKALWTSRK